MWNNNSCKEPCMQSVSNQLQISDDTIRSRMDDTCLCFLPQIVYMWQCKCKPNANVKEQNKCSYISIIKFLKFFWHCFLWKDADSLIILLRQHSYLIVESIQFLMCKFYSYFLSSLKDKIKMIIEWGLQIYL